MRLGLLGLACCYSGCGLIPDGEEGKKKAQGQQLVNHREYKTALALSSCDQLNLPRDIAFNGPFLYHLFLCSSDKTPQGGEALQGTSEVVRAMGVDGIQYVTDFLKLGGGAPREFPLIRSLAFLLERGIYSAGGDWSAGRLGPLQDLGLAFQAAPTAHFLLHLSETGQIKSFLDEILPLLEDMDNQALLAFVRSLMVDAQMRASFSTVLKAVVEGGGYRDLEEIFTLRQHPSPLLPSEMRRACLEEWLDPQIVTGKGKEKGKGQEIECLGGRGSSDSKGSSSTSGEKERPSVDLHRDLLNRLGKDKVKGIAIFFQALLADFIDRPASARLSSTMRLTHALTEMLLGHQSTVRQILSLLSYFTKVKKEDAKLLFGTLEGMVTDLGFHISSAINNKIGSYKLHREGEKLIREGGEARGCPGLKLLGLEELSLGPQGYDRTEVFEQIHSFLAPNPLCRKGLSPLASHILGPLEEHLSRSCCGEELEREKMAQVLAQANWETLRKDEETDPLLLESLLRETLAEVKEELAKDAHFLHGLRLAYGEVAPELLDKLDDKLAKGMGIGGGGRGAFTPKAIAHLDESLKLWPEFQVLRGDFLEKLLQWKIGRLSAILEQFTGLLEGTFEANIKVGRIFFNMYNDGALEQLIHSQLYLHRFGDTLPKEVSPERANEILSLLRREGVLFKNQSFNDDEANKVSFPWMGSPRYSSIFLYTKDQDEGGYLFQGIGMTTKTKLPFGFSDFVTPSTFNKLQFHILEDFLQESPFFFGHNVSKGQGQALVDWLSVDLFSELTTVATWTSLVEGFPLRPLNTRYFDTTPYSPEEAQRLALFYSTNFLYVPGALPPGATIEKRQEKRRSPINKQFLNYQTKEVQGQAWTAFQKNAPSFLGSDLTFQDFLKRLGQSFKRDHFANIPWGDLPKASEERDEEALNSEQWEVLKILSAAHLLTITNEGRYVPLIGVGQECGAPCPMTFGDFEALKTYVGHRYLEQFCPLLVAAPTSTLTLSPFVTFMEQQLELKIATSALRDYCHTSHEGNLLADANGQWDNAIPPTIYKKVLRDLFQMGKNSRLKAGLSNLVGQIRFEKLSPRFSVEPSRALGTFLKSSGILPPRLYAPAYDSLVDHRGFFFTDIGLIDEYLRFMGVFLNRGPNNDFFNATMFYGADVREMQEELEQSAFQRFLRDFLIPRYNAWASPSILEFLIQQIMDLGKDEYPEYKEYRQLLAQILSAPESLESIKTWKIFLSFILDNMKHRSSEFSHLTYWEWPSTKFLQQWTRKEFLMAMAGFFHDVDSEEIESALESFGQALIKSKLSARDIAESVSLVAQFFERDLLTPTPGPSGEIRLLRWEKALRRLAYWHRGQTLDFHTSLNEVFDRVRTPLASFQKTPANSLLSQFLPLIRYGLTHLYPLLDIYQGPLSHEDLFRKLLTSFLEVLEKPQLQEGFQEFVTILEGPELGTWEELYWPILFYEEKGQDLFLKTLAHLGRGKRESYYKAIGESGVLLPKLHPMISFVDQRLIPDDTTSPDTLHMLHVLRRLSSPDDEVWIRQVELLQHWFQEKY